MATCGEYLVRLLEAYGVELIFGIPGVHTVELYRGLPATGIRHITPRHEHFARAQPTQQRRRVPQVADDQPERSRGDVHRRDA